ncbi:MULTISPECIES: NAD-glutamate dehydrogenase [unclassified Cryobacterium]|uniref:NAD-glutamate dehydrogenase n=1 Tax=unclassified Cryobacterium TaxID=2649013 RepID=UPI002AB44A74|nr:MULTISPECIES: NAD-glutamate dehydrogenase [unclassified Cryobacterium]MDY7528655.1 NAD-glutamate dehydrogenase [Cryobacterium sp. 10C2]MEB0202459.1 NAD-glutamate dehydrogenase [Cryobacterium sp. 5I3]MEB0287674.1 NAD-glutamate dehydrogenase [Cryobacterium sp. 10S3]MEB0292226.1 NAD-glutamate dehydrogenase [Cryobacterium sp. 10C2]MEB0306290.1 NAD-glutamate dehydrogenase [Cryobacterium sp. 10I1]
MSSKSSSELSSALSNTEASTTEAFVADYYEHLGDDAREYDPATLRARAESHWQVALTRPPKTANIEIRTETDRSILYVVTDDMPFLVDSVNAELVRQHAAIHLVVHPLLVVTRNRETHELVRVTRMPVNAGVSSGDTSAMPDISHLLGNEEDSPHLESWIAIEIDRASVEARERLAEGIARVLHDVRAAVDDWPAMRSKSVQIADALGKLPHAEGIPDLAQARDLLHWLDQDNFTFLGYREYDLETVDGEDVLSIRDDSGLGLLRAVKDGHEIQHLTDAGRTMARERRALVITKANSRSSVHRPAYFDYIGIKSFDANGNVNGEQRFIGLFAVSAYTSSVRDVPILREKIDAVMAEVGFPPGSHSDKDLLGILETYPRDELFQIDVPTLVATAVAIQRLQERRRTRLFLRPDLFGRFMSALVYFPRDRYTTAVRLRIEKELTETFSAESLDFEARMTESTLARLFYRIRLPKTAAVGTADDVAALAAALEPRLAMAVRSWAEGITEQLHDTRLAHLWAEAFPPSYQVDYEVEDALVDISRFEAYAAGLKSAVARDAAASVTGSPRPGVHVYLSPNAADRPAEDARVKLYMMESQSLSQILPYFQNLGIEVLDEVPFEIKTSDGREFFLYDLGLRYPAGVDPVGTGDLLADSFGAAVSGAIESDGLDRLVLREGMPWRRVVILRSYAKYLRQMGNTNSYDFVGDTLLANPAVSGGLVDLFEARFDPARDETERIRRTEEVRAQLATAIEQVATLDADRVLRVLLNLIEATLRTNYFQNKPYLSIKLDPSRIEALPFPKPMFEIWVYSPRVEGVHLRFGMVARGGLRWSDRREDFRTEVLGLVKAQTVKNAVIVPTGAKGGFFAKKLPDPGVNRAAWLAEGIDAYKTFIRGMLDLTDNLVLTDAGEQVVPPANVVRHDDNDSYLVVAADKGTATFSDIANGLSADYGFWLGDAFASGGSIGYDHKAMGITARGAWESVKRHFGELDLDTQTEEFTVVGIGDMSGDVFGNGMLLSEHIKLVAAFDHRHVFLDPNPDPAVSFAERRRLFELPRSSWADYDTSLISAGGGVFPRQAKVVPISAEVRAVLGLPENVTHLSPPELLRAILTAPADLLYNGGIGTYVKASTETAAQVGDKANDAIRVDGRDLRVKVVGEGGNLGLTQRGRIEAALAGVLLNTDAIDNSAGVDCSDHEVNIKIFVDRMVAAGRLSAEERPGFLAAMTDEVGRLVLEDNVDQNILLLNDRVKVASWSPSYERLMDALEASGDLKRELEALPTTTELHERIDHGQGLTSPELSVLAAYAKIELTTALRDSDLADDPWFRGTLRRYFPRQLAERFDAELDTHPLRREIIATVVANDMINLGGVTFAFRAMEETSATPAAIARAFVALREIFELETMVAELSALPKSFPTEHWTAIHLDIRRLLDRAVRWQVNHGGSQPVAEVVAQYKPQIALVRAHLGDYVRGADQARLGSLLVKAEEWGLPSGLGHRWTQLFEAFALLDVVKIAAQSGEQLGDVASVYYTVYDRFGVDNLLERITALPRTDRWQALARAALRDDLYSTVADITTAVLEATDSGSAEHRLLAWEALNAEKLARSRSVFDEVNALGQDDMASLSVAMRLLRSIVRR